jgi:hypothetical protein
MNPVTSCSLPFTGFTTEQVSVVKSFNWKPGVVNSTAPVSTSTAWTAMKTPLLSVRCNAAAPPGCFTASKSVGVPVQAVNS